MLLYCIFGSRFVFKSQLVAKCKHLPLLLFLIDLFENYVKVAFLQLLQKSWGYDQQRTWPCLALSLA